MDLPEHPTLEQLVALIETLYTNKDPKTISTVQRYLQDIQKSQDGPQLAELLLSTPGLSLNCQFFGALTYTVCLGRLKTDGTPPFDPQVVLERLFHHTCSMINDHRQNKTPNLFVVRKMFQNLSMLFAMDCIRDAPVWRNPIAPICHMLATSSPPPMDLDVNIEHYIAPLMQDKFTNTILLQYMSVLVEDISTDGRVASKPDNDGLTVHTKVGRFVYPIAKGIMVNNFQSGDEDLVVAAVQSLSTWLTYIQYAHHHDTVVYSDLNDIWENVLILVQRPDNDEIVTKCIEFLTTLFEENPRSMNHELRMRFEQMIPTDWSMNLINKWMSEEDYDALNKFSMLIAMYCQSDDVHITERMLTVSPKLLEFLLNFTNFPLKPILEEQISKNMAEFWQMSITDYIDDKKVITAKYMDDPQALAAIDAAGNHMLSQLTKIYYNKIQLTVMTDPEFKKVEQEFMTFRESGAEIFDLLIVQVGSSLYEGLASAILSSNDINEIESSFFLLTSISSQLNNPDEAIFNICDNLFRNNFLQRVTELIGAQNATDLHIKYSIRFLGELEFFYQKRKDVVVSVIDYLFNCMKLYPSLQFHISRTILEICDTCREHLWNHMSVMESMLLEMLHNVSVNTYTREKFVNAFACVIQSLLDMNKQEEYIFNLLDLIEKSAQPYLQKAAQNALNEVELEYTGSLFTCVQEVAKGLVAPDDYMNSDDEAEKVLKNFWLPYKGRVHEKVKHILNIFSLEIESLAMNSQITNTATSILSDGISEPYGAFAIPYSDVMEFTFQKLTRCNLEKSYQDLLSVMASLLTWGLRKKTETPERTLTEQQASMIVKTFVADQWQFIQQDPDFIEASVVLFTSIVSARVGFLVREQETMQFMVSTCLPLLLSKQKFVIKSTCKFWQKFVGSYSKASREEEMALRQLIEGNVGPVLTENTMRGLLDAARSDLEHYGQIMVVLVAKHQLRLKEWLTHTLNMLDAERRTQNGRGLDSREWFIQRLLVTRGSQRKCMDALKEFWMEANGLQWQTA